MKEEGEIRGNQIGSRGEKKKEREYRGEIRGKGNQCRGK